jgi:hypothetical protein
MSFHNRLNTLASLRRLRPRTVRLRLTLLYGMLFLASGAVLLAITNVLVRHNTSAVHSKGLRGASIAITKAPTRASQSLPQPGPVRSRMVPVGRPHPPAAPPPLPTRPCCTNSRFNRVLRYASWLPRRSLWAGSSPAGCYAPSTQ